jgi:NADH-quinone oxidoreductase subunit E
MLRRLYHEQPESFAFTPANLEWAKGQIAKYPEGRQASAVIPLLWRSQEQEGWVTKPAIEEIGRMLGMAYIRVLEVATFYFMFQLQPTGSVAVVQVCGTTTCMICGSGDLIRVCKEKIAPRPHEISADGKFCWEEVECLGACSNAPMVQIGKDFYEDLTGARLGEIIDSIRAGEVPAPGPQNGRFSSEPLGGPVALAGARDIDMNASVLLATRIGDTVKRITGDEMDARTAVGSVATKPRISRPAESAPTPDAAQVTPTSDAAQVAPTSDAAQVAPQTLSAPIGDRPDDLKLIKGVGPELERMLHGLGFFHFSQLGSWTPEEVAWVDAHMEGFHGRIEREGWVEQARQLANEGETPRSGKKNQLDE